MFVVIYSLLEKENLSKLVNILVSLNLLKEGEEINEFKKVEFPKLIIEPEAGLVVGGVDNKFKDKYVKYKTKYLKLKNKSSN